MNQFSFALDNPCFLVHSAHYSKNWNKKKQDEYNAKYYQEHKDKWGVDGGYSETDKEIKYTGQIGDYATDDLKKLEKDHGELGDDNWLGEGGDVSLSTTKDGTKVLLNGDSIVASGKDLDGVDMKVLSKYITDIYAQAGDHASEKGLKTGTKEHADFWKEFNAKVNDQLKGLIAKQKQVKHDDFTDFLDMSSYLSHHGISGMRWGKRNGPPYPLDSKTAAAVKKQKRIKSEDYISAHDGKRSYELSDQELKRRNTRFQQEAQYRKATNTEVPTSLKVALIAIGTSLITSAVNQAGQMAVKKALSKLA